MVAKDENGNSATVPGLLVQDEQGVRRFARSKYRKEAAFKRDTKFDESNFDVKEYFDILKKENLKIELK
jgi:hypothetical protein